MNRNARRLLLGFIGGHYQEGDSGITDPRDIGGLWGWWPADNLTGQFSNLAGDGGAVTTDGDRVSAVTDKANGAAGRRLYLNGQALTRRFVYKTGIQNGKPGWQAFVGDSTASTLMTDDELNSADCTIVIAARTGTVSAGTTYAPINANNSTSGGVTIRITGNPLLWSGRTTPTDGSVTTPFTVASDTSHVVAYTSTTGPKRRIQSGLDATLDTTTAISSGNQKLRIGCANNNNQNSPWHGYIFEVAVYSPAISDSNTQLVVDYLKSKWGIS